jgi:hypothetical protein
MSDNNDEIRRLEKSRLALAFGTVVLAGMTAMKSVGAMSTGAIRPWVSVIGIVVLVAIIVQTSIKINRLK